MDDPKELYEQRDQVQIVVAGLALTLAAGDNATINIEKFQ